MKTIVLSKEVKISLKEYHKLLDAGYVVVWSEQSRPNVYQAFEAYVANRKGVKND